VNSTSIAARRDISIFELLCCYFRSFLITFIVELPSRWLQSTPIAQSKVSFLLKLANMGTKELAAPSHPKGLSGAGSAFLR